MKTEHLGILLCFLKSLTLTLGGGAQVSVSRVTTEHACLMLHGMPLMNEERLCLRFCKSTKYSRTDACFQWLAGEREREETASRISFGVSGI